jgi:hypothetical protein
MKSTLLPVLLFAAMAVAGFTPSVRIDHDDRPTNRMVVPAITIGPRTSSSQPLYVAFEDDSGPFVTYRSDIMLQKSIDAGRNWLPADLLIRRGEPYAFYPDITTDSDGNVYIVSTDQHVDTNGARHYQVSCVRSSDGGTTWTAPARVDDKTRGGIGWARIAADSAGNLLCAWNGGPLDDMHIFSSVSTDKGATWSPSVRVCRDSLYPAGCAHPDVFVQPGTNHYLVVATAPFFDGAVIAHGAYLYRSTDMGQTFQPGVRIDTFQSGGAGQPHVVADAQRIICDYTGRSGNSDILNTEARTLYTEPDTWGSPSLVSRLDTTQFWSYYNGAKLAISADGRMHTALMVCCDTAEALYLPFYVSSSDYGVTWSELELANDDTTAECWDPDIGVDSAGNAFIVWQQDPGERGEIWFSTNNPAAIAEQPPQEPVGERTSATVILGVLFLPETTSRKPQVSSCLLDISGREVIGLKPGANDVSRLSPGVYFFREEPQAASRKPQAVRKIVITK